MRTSRVVIASIATLAFVFAIVKLMHPFHVPVLEVFIIIVVLAVFLYGTSPTKQPQLPVDWKHEYTDEHERYLASTPEAR